MDQENIPKTPHKYFQVERTPSGLTTYKNCALFTPAKESAMETEFKLPSSEEFQEYGGRPVFI